MVEYELGVLQQLHLNVHEGSAVFLRSRRLVGGGVRSNSSSVSSGVGSCVGVTFDLKVSEKLAWVWLIGQGCVLVTMLPLS